MVLIVNIVCMSQYDNRFWLTAKAEYKNFVKQFERDIEITHPDSMTCVVSSDSHCTFCASNVKYIEHNP